LKWQAFLPSPDGATSMFGIDGLSQEDVWQLADENLETKVPVQFRGDIATEEIEGVGLAVNFDDTPPRHASIVDWPEGDESKEQQMELAIRLAGLSKGVKRE
jgi:hypothetical protein